MIGLSLLTIRMPMFGKVGIKPLFFVKKRSKRNVQRAVVLRDSANEIGREIKLLIFFEGLNKIRVLFELVLLFKAE